MYNNQKFYDNVRAMINHKKLKIGEIESAAGVSLGYLSRSEHNGSTPPVSLVAKLAEIFDCTIDFLATADIAKYSEGSFCLNDFVEKLIEKTQRGELVWQSDDKAVYHTNVGEKELYVAGAPIAGAWKKFSIWFQDTALVPDTAGAEEDTLVSEPKKLIAYSEDTNKDQYTFLHVRELIKLIKSVIESPIDQEALVIMKNFLAENGETPVKASESPSEPVASSDDKSIAE